MPIQSTPYPGGGGKPGGVVLGRVGYISQPFKTTSSKQGVQEKQGGMNLSRSAKNKKLPDKALVDHGMVLCPRCGRLLAKAYYGAEVKGLELWCRGKGCNIPVLVEL